MVKWSHKERLTSCSMFSAVAVVEVRIAVTCCFRCTQTNSLAIHCFPLSLSANLQEHLLPRCVPLVITYVRTVELQSYEPFCYRNAIVHIQYIYKYLVSITTNIRNDMKDFLLVGRLEV